MLLSDVCLSHTSGVVACLVDACFTFSRSDFDFYRATLYVKRGLSCRQVSVRPSVTSLYCTPPVATRLKMSSNFFRPGSSYHSSFFLTPAPIPFQWGAQNIRDGKFLLLRFSTEIAVHLGNGTR